MKRSEMLLIIAEQLVDRRYKDPKKEADFLLKRLEKAGMLPPPKPDKELEGSYYVDINEWEEE